MAWETRGGEDEYFYLSQRLPDGRIRKKYFGKGLLAEVESLWLERKAAVRHQLSEEQKQTAAAETLLKQHLRSTTDVTHALMLSIGYTNERSRGWRRLPMIAPHEANNELGHSTTEGNEPSFSELANAARQGDRSVIPVLRRMIWENPRLAKFSGDLAGQTQLHWIDLITGQDLFYRECLLMKMAKLKQKLLAETKGTVVEEMLVDQAISTWLQLYYHEDREATRPAANIQLGEYRLRKVESAFNRHMRSLNALTALKAINFTDRMAQTMASPSQDTGGEQSNLCSPPVPVSRTNGNRLRKAFSQTLEPIPMN